MALKSAEQCIIAQLVRVGMPKPVIRAILDIDMRTLQGYIDDNNLQVVDETIAISRGKTPQAIHRAAKTFVEHRNLYELMEVLTGLPQELRALLYREIAQILESEGKGKKAPAGGNGHGT
jgi:hypothetical protein